LWPGYDLVIRNLGGDSSYPQPTPGDIEFLTIIGLAQDGERLSNLGREYFRARWIFADNQRADEILRSALLTHPVVILLCQVFHGRGAVRRSQLCDLLTAETIPASEEEIGRLLLILSQFTLITYNKQKNTFVVHITPQKPTQPPVTAFLAPQTPFSNVQRFKEVLDTAQGELIWLDKHFDRKAFPLLADVADGTKLTKVVIISGDYNLNDAAKLDFSLLQRELSERGVELEWLMVEKVNLRDVHDRWLVSDNWAYNIPPVNSIFGGQAAEVSQSNDRSAVIGIVAALTEAAKPVQ
jgi:hypothetical protein